MKLYDYNLHNKILEGEIMNELDKKFFDLVKIIKSLTEKQLYERIKLNFMSLPSIYKDILEDYFKRFDFWGTLDIKNGDFDEISGKAHILSKHIKDFIGYTTNLRTIRQNFYFMPYSITGISMTSSH